MCQAYEAEASFVAYLERTRPLCPRCKTAKALVYPHCGKCQKWAYQSALRGKPECSCKWCRDTKSAPHMACKCDECKTHFNLGSNPAG